MFAGLASDAHLISVRNSIFSGRSVGVWWNFVGSPFEVRFSLGVGLTLCWMFVRSSFGFRVMFDIRWMIV